MLHHLSSHQLITTGGRASTAGSSNGRSEHSVLHTTVNGLHLWCDMFTDVSPQEFSPLCLFLSFLGLTVSLLPPPLPSCLSFLQEPAQRAMSFTGQLRSLAACVSPLPTPPAVLSEISTPWDYRAWEDMLHTHPDREFADIIVNGFGRASTLVLSTGDSGAHDRAIATFAPRWSTRT